MRTLHTRRRGLTMIELLVVITIIVALFSIVALVGPRFGERQRVGRGASQLQSWLLIAKQMSLRDGAPRGIRLLPLTNTPANAQYVRQVQYIEQPEPYQPVVGDNTGYPAAAQLRLTSGTSNQVTIQFPSTVSNPSVPLAAALKALWPDQSIAPDVVLEFHGRYPGQPRRVLNIANNGSALTVTLDQPFELPPAMANNVVSTDYRFFRKAQPLVGEPILELPRDIGIDISRDDTNVNSPAWYRFYPPLGNSLSAQPFDILFDSRGQVIGAAGRTSNRICLWIRDVTLLDPCPGNQLPPGENILIAIYTRSGLIAAHPVDPNGLSVGTPSRPWNPFSFTQDGRSSGM